MSAHAILIRADGIALMLPVPQAEEWLFIDLPEVGYWDWKRCRNSRRFRRYHGPIVPTFVEVPDGQAG